jgi:hypothetical protein
MNLIKAIVLIGILILTTSFHKSGGFVEINGCYLIEEDTVFLDKPIPKQIPFDSLQLTKVKVWEYKKVIAKLETGNAKNPYIIVNQYGYMGKYQFGNRTLNHLKKIGALKYEGNFIGNPKAQEAAMDALTKRNRLVMKRMGLYRYIGKQVNGVYITEEGLLAGAHLLGAGNVKKFILDGKYSYDGNGTNIKKYIGKFE